MTKGDYKKNIADFIKEIAPSFERSSIMAELELENQDDSFSDIRELYGNGIGALGSLSFEGDVLDALRVYGWLFCAYAFGYNAAVTKKCLHTLR